MSGRTKGRACTVAHPAWIPEFEDHAQKKIAAHNIPGLAVGVGRHGEVTYARGFGHRDRENGLPVTPDTVFGIASITKSFTAAAIMQLQEAGRLSVQDPVVKHLPEFRTPNREWTRQMTVHHFLTHTSGLPPLPSHWFAGARAREGDPSVEGNRRRSGLAPITIQWDPIDTDEQLMEFTPIRNSRQAETLGRPRPRRPVRVQTAEP